MLLMGARMSLIDRRLDGWTRFGQYERGTAEFRIRANAPGRRRLKHGLGARSGRASHGRWVQACHLGGVVIPSTVSPEAAGCQIRGGRLASGHTFGPATPSAVGEEPSAAGAKPAVTGQ